MVVVNNLTALKVDNNFIKKIAEKVLLGEKFGKKELSIVLTEPSKIKSLNRQYRRKNRTTDVLTFADLDIVICPMVVKSNAKKASQTFRAELAKVVIHGVLHWLGYEHEKNGKEAEGMRSREERYLNKLTVLKLKTKNEK